MKKIDDKKPEQEILVEGNPSTRWEEMERRARAEMDMTTAMNGGHMPSLNMAGICTVRGQVFSTPLTTSENLDKDVDPASIRYHVRKRIAQGEEIPVVPGFNRVGQETNLYPEDELIEGVRHLITLKVRVNEDGIYVSKRGFEYLTIPAISRRTGIPEQTIRRNFTSENPLKKRPKSIPARDSNGKRIEIYRIKDIEEEIKQLQSEIKAEAILDEREYCTIEGEEWLTIIACIRDMLKDAKKIPKRTTVQKRIESAKTQSKQARKSDGSLVNIYKKTDLENLTRVYTQVIRVDVEGEKKGIYTDENGDEYAPLTTWLRIFEVSENAFKKGFEDTLKGKWPEGSSLEGIDLSNKKTILYKKTVVEGILSYILNAEAVLKDGVCVIQDTVRSRVESCIGQAYKTDQKLFAEHGKEFTVSRATLRRQMISASAQNPSAKITVEAVDRKKGTSVTVFNVQYALDNFGKK